MFIKLTLRLGYHPYDTNANTETFVNPSRIDYYYDDYTRDGYKSTIYINSREFICAESAAEISEKIELAKIADSVK